MEKIVLELTLEQAKSVYYQIEKDKEYFDNDSSFSLSLLEVLKKLEEQGIGKEEK